MTSLTAATTSPVSLARNASRWVPALVALSVCAALAGCMAPAQIAMDIEKAGVSRDIGSGKAVLLHHIKTLQAQGDPLGDYFYALGNSDGWIQDVQSPVAITDLFVKAAAKGSMDAKILLALQKATSRPVPCKLDEGMSPRDNLQAWDAGLTELLPLLQQQCYVRRLVIGSGRNFTTEMRPHVDTYAVAYKIWPKFRDGYYRYNEDGSRTLIRQPERQKVWEDLHKGCRMPSEQWLDNLYKK